jgi:hypothetical protein
VRLSIVLQLSVGQRVFDVASRADFSNDRSHHQLIAACYDAERRLDWQPNTTFTASDKFATRPVVSTQEVSEKGQMMFTVSIASVLNQQRFDVRADQFDE